jgi:hypothetical protein
MVYRYRRYPGISLPALRSIIAGVLGWVLLACTEKPSLADSLRWYKDYAEEDLEGAPDE